MSAERTEGAAHSPSPPATLPLSLDSTSPPVTLPLSLASHSFWSAAAAVSQSRHSGDVHPTAAIHSRLSSSRSSLSASVSLPPAVHTAATDLVFWSAAAAESQSRHSGDVHPTAAIHSLLGGALGSRSSHSEDVPMAFDSHSSGSSSSTSVNVAASSNLHVARSSSVRIQVVPAAAAATTTHADDIDRDHDIAIDDHDDGTVAAALSVYLLNIDSVAMP